MKILNYDILTRSSNDEILDFIVEPIDFYVDKKKQSIKEMSKIQHERIGIAQT